MKRALLCLLVLSLCPCLSARARDEPKKRLDYPETKRKDGSFLLHGERIADPFRWLEDDDAPAVKAWDEAQLALLRGRLDAFPGRERLRQRLAREYDQVGMKSLPTFEGGKRWFLQRPKGADHARLYVTSEDGSAEARVVLDPNLWSADGTAGMKAWRVSPDGRHVAYRMDENGSEDTTLYVRDVKTGKNLPEHITRTKFSSILWTRDSLGFFYGRNPEPDSVPAAEIQYHDRIFYHRIGTLVLDDPMVYGQGRPMLENAWLHLSADDEHLLLSRGMPYQSIDNYEVEMDGTRLKLTPLIVGKQERTYVDRVGDTYILNTDRNTGRREVFTAKREPAGQLGQWKPFTIPRGPEGVIDETWVVDGRLIVCHTREDVISHLFVKPLDGGGAREIKLPGPGAVGRVVTKRNDTRIWFSFQSHARPTTLYRCDVGSESLQIVAEESLPTTVDVSALVSSQTTFKSKDGTAVPLFLLHRKDTPLDGTAPTILYGYGGFRVGMAPYFSRSRALWAEMGGVLAVACLRGGDELGEAWHQAGSLGNKQNVFDDFIAAADWLVSSGRASRERLAIKGASNGGLLVAVVANQRPDLCAAVHCGVPLTDMLRYHRFQYARSWTKEYGDPDVAEQFAWIRPYSPYHNVAPGTAYPAVLLTAGLADGRVNAFHARKMAAQWQAASTSGRPVLLRVDRKGGHGAAGLTRRLEQVLDGWCFLLMELGR